jgi:hypothetical protein
MNKSYSKKVLSSGLTFLFISLVMIVTERALKEVKDEEAHLKSHLEALKEEKNLKEKQNALLVLQIQSSSDPAWIELVLKRELGLIPEGQTKVVFK